MDLNYIKVFIGESSWATEYIDEVVLKEAYLGYSLFAELEEQRFMFVG